MGNLSEGLMKAQILTRPGLLEYKDIEIPRISENQVLVKLISAAICNGSDPSILAGLTPHPTPMVFGHEPYGEVVCCGKNVKELNTGDRISWWFTTGAFAEYVAIDPSLVAVTRVPEILTDEAAPILELVAASARAVKREDVCEGSRVLIVGLGPSGLIMAQRAKILGASVVVGWDLYPLRRQKGLELGCDAVFDPSVKRAGEETGAFAGEFDLVIDAMGDDILPGEPTLDMAIKVLKQGGRIVSYGHPFKGRKVTPFYFQAKNAVMVAPENDMNNIRRLFHESTIHVAEGKLRLKPLISCCMQLSEVKEGLSLVMDHPDQFLKIIIKM